MSRDAAETRRWRIKVFGAFAATRPDGLECALRSRKAVELIGFLALRRNGRISREVLANELWPDADSVAGRNRLKQTLSTIHKELPGFPIVALGKHEIEFLFDQIDVESRQLQERARWLGILSGPTLKEAAAQLLNVISDPLLPGIDAPWVVGERVYWERLRQKAEAAMGAWFGDAQAFRYIEEWPGVAARIVGRQPELESVQRWFESDSRRLAIVGPPGVGKTRLARAFVEMEAPPFDAVVALTTMQAKESSWTERLAQVLGHQSVERITAGLTGLLRSFSAPLLVLDDYDQAAPEMLEWAEHLAVEVPRLKTLVTARRLPTRFEIAALGPLASKDGLELLQEFAALSVSHSVPTLDEPTLGRIAERLEGLPLALEVAAGWLSYLSPAGLLRRLEDESRIVLDQHSGNRNSLLNCIASVLFSVSEQDQEVAVFMAVSHGGCGEFLADLGLDNQWPLAIRRLAEHSLTFPAQGLAVPRHYMLQAVRESIRQVVPHERVAATEERHALAVIGLLARASEQGYEGDRNLWIRMLTDECDNICSGLEYVRTHPRHLSAALHALFAAFGLLYHTPQLESIRLTRAALVEAAKEIEGDLDIPAKLVLMGSRVGEFRRCGRIKDALELNEQQLEMAADHPYLSGGAWSTRARLLRELGEYDLALQALKVSQECYLKSERPRHALWLEADAAAVEIDRGRADLAEARKRRARAQAAVLEDHNSAGVYDREFALHAHVDRRLADALALCDSSIEMFRKAGERRSVAEMLVWKATWLAEERRNNEALQAAASAEELLFPDQVEALEKLHEVKKSLSLALS